MARVALERRKSDFHAGGAVTAYTGACSCCCCCLHWVGAAIGGGVGMYKARKQPAPAPTRIRSALNLSAFLGFLLFSGVFVIAYAMGESDSGTRMKPFMDDLDDLLVGLLGVAAFVPCVVFVPPAVMGVLATLRLRRKLRRSYQAEHARGSTQLPIQGGAYRAPLDTTLATRRALPAIDGFEAFCPSCWESVGEGLYAERCPSCKEPMVKPEFKAANEGVRLAWRVAAYSLGGSLLGMAAGYLLMVAIGLVVR